MSTNRIWRFVKREFLLCYVLIVSAWQLYMAYAYQPDFIAALCLFIMGICLASEVIASFRRTFPDYDPATRILAEMMRQIENDRKFVGSAMTITVRRDLVLGNGQKVTLALTDKARETTDQ